MDLITEVITTTTNYILEIVSNASMALQKFPLIINNAVFVSILTGVLIFLISQIILKFVIEPINKFKNILLDIDSKLRFYSNVIVNPPSFIENNELPEEHKNAKEELRRLSCSLSSFYRFIPLKRLFIRLNIIPIKEDVKIARDELIWLSNITGHENREVEIDGESKSLSLHANYKISNIRKSLNIIEF